MKIEFGLSVLSKRETLLGLQLTTHNGIVAKDNELYIKVKQQHIKQLKKLNFEKENVYKTNLNLIYYDKDQQGYYTSMVDTKEVKSDDAFESD